METIFLIIALIWSILCLILFFKVWGMTSDVSEIKELLKGISYNKQVSFDETTQQDKSTENTLINVDEIKVTDNALKKAKAFKKGDTVESPRFGTLTYYGKWNGKHALYPANGQRLIDSPFVVRNSSGDYLAVTDEEFTSLL